MKFLQDLDLSGKVVLLRLNLNVPIRDGIIQDDFRVKSVLSTIQYVKERAKKTVITAHLGRPQGRDVSLSLKPVAEYLKKSFGEQVVFLNDSLGEDVQQGIVAAKDGSVIVLENVRFHKGERENDEGVGKAIARLADIFVNDAFGDSYEPYASVTRPPAFIPSAAGLRLQQELQALDRLKNNPQHPFLVLVGGVKIREKMGTIKLLGAKADHVLVGGGIANTLLAAAGIDVKESLIQEDEIPLAQELKKQLGDKLVIPVDVRVATKLSNGDIDKKSLRFSKVNELKPGECIFDIGPETVKLYADYCRKASDVFWAGPMGYIEWDMTAIGSMELAKLLAVLPNYCVVGGGETASLVASAGLIDKMDFVSTGGGAALKYLSGEALPGLVALSAVH
jgi:phosphoglycerate kinase